eukprot:TRINITY_DN94102_c0_g1_i1.p1 TRINITY_DN94102_c0_g1~~TRINITY_DN94102_c0_g1_i1.p1  ORF type:complete len:380 (+),score=39.42 TRINITY_DN94102_c0_g1_i1:50-1189(+)
MADTVNLNELQEFRDTSQQLDQKVQQLAAMVSASNHMIFYTGAGISTAASIPDFRGPNGVWTCQAQGRDAPACVSLVTAQPTGTHKTIAKLVQSGKAKYVVSQNVDGLHLRSGLPRDKLSELHGNCFLEVCWGCGADFLHDQEVGSSSSRPCSECRQRVPHFCHCTGRKCPKCGGNLKDSVIHFGENLPKHDLKMAFQHASRADLCVVAGSSCRVTPAADVPETVGNNKNANLVIINLQKTPLDNLCKLRIWGDMEEVFSKLAQQLSLNAPTQVAPQPARQPQPQFVVRQTHKPVGGECGHEWALIVEGPEVESVVFKLHPTFSPSIIEERQAPFTVCRQGWGVFNVHMLVTLKGRVAPVEIDHYLQFDTPEVQKQHFV